MKIARLLLLTISLSWFVTAAALAAGGRPVLTVVETVGDHYTITAHDSDDPAIEYWEILVDIQSGGIYSFKDLTDAGDGGSGHNSYLDVSAYGRKTTLLHFAGRGGDVFSRITPVANLNNKLNFTTDPEGRSFTITYTETPATVGYYHSGYADGDRSLAPGELLTTVTLVISPPVYNGTLWDWTISYENVSDHDLSAKIWAVDKRHLWLHGSLVKTSDSDTTRTDSPWNPAAPLSFTRWTMGDNSSLGLTTGRQFILDPQTGVEGYTYGGGATVYSWAGFDSVQYAAGYAITASDALAPSEVRTETGQVIIDIVGAGTSQLPIADAGPDQTLTDSDNTGSEDATLDASGSYDPDGTIVSYAWEKNSVEIATGVSPTISLAPGVHTIELIATDDTGDIGFDTVIVTVNAYFNNPPTVEAGPNQTITPGQSNLYGQASDDGLPLPGILTTTWTATGPASVVFGDANAAQTTATFTTNGVYTLQLIANDGELTTIDTLTVTVDSMVTPSTLRSSISQYGITWTFDRPYQTGQFATGDYWVVGPVTITAIDPKSELLLGTTSLSGFELGGTDPQPRTMNGSMLNPVTPPGGSTQGFDSDMYQWHPTSGRIYGPNFDPAMNVALDVDAANPLVIQPDSSLVSSISYPNGTRPQLKAAAVLTVLDNVPADNGAQMFRPPYVGSSKPLYLTTDLRKDLLPNLPFVANMPVLASVVAEFQRPWIDHFGHIGDGTQYSSPFENMPDYGREYSRAVGRAALMLLLDENNLIATYGQNKDALLINFVQLGLDSYHVTETGGYWWGLGGLNHGRKWPIIFAGLMLDNEHMRTIGSRSKTMLFWGFAEDGQTKYLDQSDVDMTHSPQWRPDSRASVFIPAEVEDIGLPEWNVGGFAPGLEPQQLNLVFDCPYRVVNGMSYPSIVLPALLMGQKDVWQHDALFDYTDRYVVWAPTENSWSDYQLSIYNYGGAFQRAMWEAYRYAIPGVQGRFAFYNNSSYDNNDPAANANDDNAIAPDKTALLPGETAAAANYTTYSLGINGIIIDILDTTGPITAADFQFNIGNTPDPSTWPAAPTPTSITTRTGVGVGTSDRVTIIFPDNSIRKQWLKVTVLANSNTGLNSDDVFYFGNAPGDTLDQPTNAIVNATDEIAARNAPRHFINPATITNPNDHNRDAKVDASDQIISRNNTTTAITALILLTAP